MSTTSHGDAAAQVTDAELARLGLAGVAEDLAGLELWPQARHGGGPARLLRELAAAPNAAEAVSALARVVAAQPEARTWMAAAPHVPVRVATTVGASDALADLLTLRERLLAHLAGDLEPWDVATVRRLGAAALGESEPEHALVWTQREGLLRIAARDLLGMTDTPGATAELSDLAEGLITAVCQQVAGDAPLSVIGMGKLGARELNYVSDVDVMFVTADGTVTEATRAAEQLLRLLGSHTAHGRAYEVDANLRPEGRDGPLVRTLEGYARYYERWAAQWELQALLKARPVGGDAELGRAFTDLIAGHVWPDRLDGQRVAEIQRMKARVEASKSVQRHGAREVKLAPGGLRDIEFAVQLLQLVHGRHDASLRQPGTLDALWALAAGGYVDEGDAALFGDAYQFLRTVEHRLQLWRLRRTHALPGDDDQRERIARTVGFRDLPTATALAQFDREYERVQSFVRRLHEKLFFRPLLERFAELTRQEQLADTEGNLDEQAARDRLAALGFADPRAAIDHLDALASGLSRRSRLFRTLLPALLPTLAGSADPDVGLAALRQLADRLQESPSFLRTLADNPPVGDLLVGVLGSSRVVGEWLQRQPELFTVLADRENLETTQSRGDYQRLADGLRVRGDDEPGHSSALLVSLVVPEGLRLAVIGMGKLGGGELGYASDLDVMLVHDGDGPTAAAAVERLLRLVGEITPEGAVFEVDLKLRPEGTDGPLTRTLDSYRQYYQRWAQGWEILALTQARPVAGDAELGARFAELIDEVVYADQPSGERLDAVRRMKARLEAERGRPGPQRPGAAAGSGSRSASQDLKLGPGGLSDVEWTVQLLQLAHGGQHEALRVPGCLAGLDAAAGAGLLDAEEVEWLRGGWRVQSRVRNVAYLVGLRDTAVLPTDEAQLQRLARVLGYPAHEAQSFADDLARARRRVRKVHERHFYGA
ncbi:MAG: bifunctional glutamine-synthetase adenylyltransferase/deadenyltransferase [Actinobacteria bacterium QS_5_72_10]|nr:MAG: bifunctional glutamine-synthetase adenylyltransferase/deadenyltransferase [Actinobacteria bacterium QS_5_72_10]